jgi:hypothetical protein
MVEVFAVGKFGAEAAFSSSERLLIEPSLARLIERYGAVAEQFSWLIDPAMLAVGVVMYSARLAKMAVGQAEAADRRDKDDRESRGGPPSGPNPSPLPPFPSAPAATQERENDDGNVTSGRIFDLNEVHHLVGDLFRGGR